MSDDKSPGEWKSLRCPACCSSQETRFIATGCQAPWISLLSGGSAKFKPVSLLRCEVCQFSFFFPRHSDEDLTGLYQGYRDKHYLLARKSWEPWYRLSWNNSRNPGKKGALKAKEDLERILSELPDTVFDCVADVGGDMGQFFPEKSRQRILVERSYREELLGVNRVDSIDNLPEGVSLVILGCVLPHIPEPKDLLEQIRRNAPEAYVLVQVAQDLPRISTWSSTVAYRRYLEWLARNRFVFVLVDFFTGLVRQFLGSIPVVGIVKASEHLNYFTEESLNRLLAQCEYEPIVIETSAKGGLGGIKLGSLSIVAKPSHT